jgi:polysaccharide export outer membrane protein
VVERRSVIAVAALLLGVLSAQTAENRAMAQTAKPGAEARPSKAPEPGTIAPPADYVIGPDDVLVVTYWREDKMSGEVVVRPDGKVSLPLINDIQAAGLTVGQFRDSITKAATKYLTDPSVSVTVKAINSRRVFVTGSVNKPGPYPLNDMMTVLQMLAVAGGLNEFAKEKEIRVMRVEGGVTKSFKFNYRDVTQGKGLEQNIQLKPGDTIVVR